MLLRAAFYTLGCKVNQYETSVLRRRFVEEGFSIVEPQEEAEVYVLNSCTVTATGDKKTRQALRRFRRQSPGAILVLCGCFPQAFPKEAQSVLEADVVAGTSHRSGLVELVRERIRKGERIVRIVPHQADEPFEPMQAGIFGSRARAFVKIEDGCRHHCAYCIIPTARGPVRSKALPDLRRELEELAAAGFREVVLTGINLSCYGQDTGGRLLDAVRLACGTPGVERVRLGSLEPEPLGKEDIRELALLTGLCPQFHLSLQSGCDQTLHRMGRHYNAGEYRRIVENLRESFPGCAVTTDMMVGFPGETEEEFLQSAEFAHEIGFARVHIFAYSPRPGTPAASMPEQVEEGEKAHRGRELARITGQDSRAFMESQLGTEARVLLETSAGPGRWEGYSENYTPVLVQGSRGRAGEIETVVLTGVEGDRCTGWV